MLLRRALAVTAVIALAAGAAYAWLARPRLPDAERGRRLAEQLGCFGCHGADGLHGAPNPGRKEQEVPNFAGDVMMYAHDADDVRAWITDGVTPAKAKSESWKAARDAGALRMPAYGDRLRPADLDLLVAYVLAASGDPAPPDGDASAGKDRARDLGCFGCHGAGGRLARPNAGSFKGYVPAWDGEDFAELVRDRAEFDQWVRDGVSERFRDDAAASFFLRRAMVHMPAFRDHLDDGDLDLLWAYVSWLRAPEPAE